MSRVKIQFPDSPALFQTVIKVRIGDINYGNHLGNDSLISILHEARLQCLADFKFTEMDAGGSSLIMADLMVAYKGEAFYGDELEVSLYASLASSVAFDLYYKVSTMRGGQRIDVAEAKTAMVCFDYTTRRVVTMGEPLKSALIRA